MGSWWRESWRLLDQHNSKNLFSEVPYVDFQNCGWNLFVLWGALYSQKERTTLIETCDRNEALGRLSLITVKTFLSVFLGVRQILLMYLRMFFIFQECQSLIFCPTFKQMNTEHKPWHRLAPNSPPHRVSHLCLNRWIFLLTACKKRKQPDGTAGKMSVF